MTGSPELGKYILDHISAEEDFLTELDRETNLNILGARMLSGHLQGKILSMLSSMITPMNILEIGTFTGYSAICLAQGLKPGGHLHTFEVNDELEHIAGKYFRKAGLNDVIIQHAGDALHLVPGMDLQFELVFIDGDKREYPAYYEMAFGKVPVGGYIIADNTLWNGKILEEPEPNDEQTKGILAFNEMVKNDHRVEKVILPIRDGMTIIRKTSE
ncbi:MAG: methyltransferase [Bacteroidetes bacterium GWF2_42_66]|nr:MAG: methyltransferase [Bacteroidetes bacterium GWA2_42_15]OFY02912.1 MAG: methyltransferase [Bacteroidetes bacterium GWE2_42_39]OFY44567.1 MAG: methyltransferase [Bacteroidetes bacterium GWF2_42_66]HBL74873.1 methyltransferase [Prolixibacteraceae bacterium]HCR91722.1 methyltransferase [Prolixibacteraceae bacterium]